MRSGCASFLLGALTGGLLSLVISNQELLMAAAALSAIVSLYTNGYERTSVRLPDPAPVPSVIRDTVSPVVD